MTRCFVKERGMFGVLIISELLAGAYSLIIARVLFGKSGIDSGAYYWSNVWGDLLLILVYLLCSEDTIQRTEKLFGGGGVYYRDIAGG